MFPPENAQSVIDEIVDMALAAQKACDNKICRGCPAYVLLDDRVGETCIFDEILEIIQWQAEQETECSPIVYCNRG